MPRRNNTQPHQRFEFVSACANKRRFASEKLAREAAEHQMLVKPELELAVYKCELCGGWHLTRRQPR